LEIVLEGLERDAEGILQYMASNGLVANLGGCNEEDLQVKVGNIQISRSTTGYYLVWILMKI
jgi:hypothetical protein